MKILTPQSFLDFFSGHINKKGGHRYAVLATQGLQSFPQARNVVIRNYNLKDHKLRIYTHGLSEKVGQLKSSPYSSFCWYEPMQKIQIQMYTKATIANNPELSLSLFEQASKQTKSDYITNGIQYLQVIDFNVIEYKFLKLDSPEHIHFEYKPVM